MKSQVASKLLSLNKRRDAHSKGHLPSTTEINVRSKSQYHFKTAKLISFTSPGETFTRNPARNIKFLSPTMYLSNFKQTCKEFTMKRASREIRNVVIRAKFSHKNKLSDLGLYGKNAVNTKKFRVESTLRHMLRNCTVVPRLKSRAIKPLTFSDVRLLITGVAAEKHRSISLFHFELKNKLSKGDIFKRK
eukprot:TRINITY_DN16678_c0_g1_i1.p2 TRINITY_DN16678_c0_g1~~TRINITY_DN16678_c0_g1_i1.p2  ORF type:complete len:190 (+),score=16.36 TRINITY_DN16678_c0_g1_i1:112-681(+)